MKRRRVAALLIVSAILVIAAVAFVLLPYLHYRATRRYIGFNLNHLERYRHAPTSEFIQQIEELGNPDHIHSEADALAYVEALHARMLPPFTDLDTGRLARAEYAAIRDPQKRIPESLVAKTFNALADKWQAPASKITIEELHLFRIAYFVRLHSRTAGLQPDGSFPRDCRPAEAFLLLEELNRRGGVDEYLRIQLSTRLWLAYRLHLVERDRPYRLAAEFSIARTTYFAWHHVTSEQFCNDLFQQLGIS